MIRCLVRLIYFYRFADFKLQRNNVQRGKLSFPVVKNFDTEFITSVLISQDMYTTERDFLIRYLTRSCAKHGISKRIFRNTLVNLITEAVEDVSFRSTHIKMYYV